MKQTETPPCPPWRELVHTAASGGYLTIVYNDDMSPIPVRWITKPGDNKSDPNLETLTYGLFSTCGLDLRRGIVKNRYKYLFFATNWRGNRALTGYYEVRWYAAEPMRPGDFCLAASSAHFLKEPLLLSAIDKSCGTETSKQFRLYIHLSPDDCQKLLQLIHQFPDYTDEYLKEIDRLERFNLKHGGFRYIGWKQYEKFSWQFAHDHKYLDFNQTVVEHGHSSNSSPNDLWECRECQYAFKNKALLKRCPECGRIGSLFPYVEAI